MTIELTAEEKEFDLEDELKSVVTALYIHGEARLSARWFLQVTRISLWLKAALAEALSAKRSACEELDSLQQRLDKARDDASFLKGERDKLAAEIEDWCFRPATPFDEAVGEVQQYHTEQLESLPEDERDDRDPFSHQELSEKHGLGLDGFPLTAIESTLKSNDMGSYESWRFIAHNALLAMSYLRPLYEGNDSETEEFEDECKAKGCADAS